MRVDDRSAMLLLRSVLQNEQRAEEYQVNLLRKTMDAQKETGEQLVQMIEKTQQLLDIYA